MKRLKHRIEAIAVDLLFTAFRALPLDTASFVGGFMARSIGPFLRAHRIAKNNLSMVYPDMGWKEKRILLNAIWDNLGRVAAELPHLPDKELFSRVHINGVENIPAAGKPMLFFSGHIGNWELNYPIAHAHHIPVTLIYRQANNPYVDKIVCDLRASKSNGMFPKGPSGVVKMLRAIKDGQTLAMLIDQKMNDGIAVPFFGRPAMTAPAIAELALRYDMPIIPTRVIRTKGCHFEATVFPALQYEKSGDTEKDVLTIMTQINALVESWVRENPEQWFWVHKRWPNT